MLQTMETFQEMSQTFSALQEIFPDMSGTPPFGNASSGDNTAETSNSGNSPFNMMDMLMNMLTPEQREMYEMFQQQNIE